MNNFNKKYFILFFAILFFSFVSMDNILKIEVETNFGIFRIVRNSGLVLNNLKGFLNRKTSFINETINEGSYKIEIFGVNFENSEERYIGIRVYDEDKPICSFALYGAEDMGLYEGILEVSRRKENNKKVDIGYTAEEILSLLKKTPHLLIPQFPQIFNKRTFEQIETRMAYALFKKHYAELKSQKKESRLEAFVRTVDEIKAISEYEIKASYIADFLSKPYFRLGEFREFSVLYNMVNELGGIKVIREKFQSYVSVPDCSRFQAIDRIIQNYFYEHNIKDLDYISSLLLELNLISVSDLTGSNVINPD